MIYIFAVLFATVSVVYLTGCLRGNAQITTALKPLLMPLLMATAITILIPYRTDARSVLVCVACALAAGTLGDIFLLAKGKTCFLAGATAFLAGHIFWISINAAAFRGISRSALIAGLLVYATFVLSAYRMAGKPSGFAGAGVICYALVLCALNFTGIAALIAYKNTAATLYFAGATLFLTSDTMLGYEKFRHPFKFSQFSVMVTYIAAQTLLTAGAILPVLAR